MPGPTKIVFWESTPPFEAAAGGIPSYIQHRARILTRDGFEVWWSGARACARWDEGQGEWLERVSFPCSPFRRMMGRRFVSRTPAWEHLVERVRPHVAEFAEGFDGVIPFEKDHPRICLQCHASGQARYFLNREKAIAQGLRLRLGEWFVRHNLKKAKGVIACSHEIALLESGFFRVHPDRFTVLPHALSPRAEAGLAIKNGKFQAAFFLVVGNIEFVKGFDLVAEGFLRYRSRGGRGTLKVAGTTGPSDPNPQVQGMLNTPAVRKLMEATGERLVEFLGKLTKDRLAEVRARCAAVVIGSRFEAFSMVAGEASLSRCPVILSDRTGWRGLAERFHGARLFSPYDPDDLAQAMFDVEDPAKRAALQEGGDRVAAYLGSEELIGKTVAFYRGLLQ